VGFFVDIVLACAKVESWLILTTTKQEIEMSKKYLVAGKVFNDLSAAIDYANFICKVSRIIVAVEEVK
jgi:hypothetical protein